MFKLRQNGLRLHWLRFFLLLGLVFDVAHAQMTPSDSQTHVLSDILPRGESSKNVEMLQTDIHADWADILNRYALAGANDLNLFDYQGLSQSKEGLAQLRDYITQLASMQPSTMPRAKAMSYWANLYNALTVQIVAENWPVKSIRQIKSGLFSVGPWDRKLVTVEGQRLTLNNIEHDILRLQFSDPHIHYMLNCASLGCPNLKRTPWKANMLERDLKRAAAEFVNSPRAVWIQDDKLYVSSIYKWFKKDFGNRDQTIIDHILTYSDDDLKSRLESISKISGHDYDWSINAVGEGRE